MILRVEIENFYSIQNPQVIDLVAGKYAEAMPERFTPVGADQLCPKVIAIFGANASGKSNVLKALSFIAWFVRESFKSSPTASLPFRPFLGNHKSKPTRLAIWFTGAATPEDLGTLGERPCKYAYEVSFIGSDKEQRVISESLRYWPLDTGRPVTIFHRDEDGSVKGSKVFGLVGYSSAVKNILRPKVSVITTLAQLQHPIATRLWEIASTLVSNILIEKSDFHESALTEVYRTNPPLLKALNREIERIDVGIQKMNIAVFDGMVQAMQFHHNGFPVPLSTQSESNGTKEFIKTFPLLYGALEAGNVAIVDELDLSIHPLVLPEILNWFYDPQRNKNNAQLWMTAQSPSLLESLIKEEVFFCEKDSEGRTDIYGLRDIKSVRRDDNFYRKYMGGVYGAIPHLG